MITRGTPYTHLWKPPYDFYIILHLPPAKSGKIYCFLARNGMEWLMFLLCSCFPLHGACLMEYLITLLVCVSVFPEMTSKSRQIHASCAMSSSLADCLDTTLVATKLQLETSFNRCRYCLPLLASSVPPGLFYIPPESKLRAGFA